MSPPTVELYKFVIGLTMVLTIGTAFVVTLLFLCGIRAYFKCKRGGGRTGTILWNRDTTTSGDLKRAISKVEQHGRRINGQKQDIKNGTNKKPKVKNAFRQENRCYGYIFNILKEPSFDGYEVL